MMRNISIQDAEYVDGSFGNMIMKDVYNSGDYFSNANNFKAMYFMKTHRILDNASHYMGELRDDIFMLKHKDELMENLDRIKLSIPEMKRRYQILSHYYPREWFITTEKPGADIRPVREDETNDVYQKSLEGIKVFAEKRYRYGKKTLTDKGFKEFKKTAIDPLYQKLDDLNRAQQQILSRISGRART